VGPYSAGMGPTGPRRRHQVLQSSQRWGAEVPGLALRAFVDGVDLGGLGGSGCWRSAPPGGLAAGVGAPSAASDWGCW